MAKEIMEGLVKTDKGIVKIVGYDGATFTPHVSEDFVLSWTNDKGLENPEPVKLPISKGEISIGEEEPMEPNILIWIDTGNVSVKYRDTKTGTFAEVQSGGSTDDGSVKKHNESETAHNDIRLLLAGLSGRLNAIADSDDTTLDQLSEIVAYIKANKTLIESVTTSKVNVADIIDNLTTSVSNKPLSAKMGVELANLVRSAESVASSADAAAYRATENAESALNHARSAMDLASSARSMASSAEQMASEAQAEIEKLKENGVPGGGTSASVEEIHIGADEPTDGEKLWIDLDDDGDGLTAEDVKNALGYTPANAEAVGELSEAIADKVSKTGITLGLHSDGKYYIFVDGTPVGTGLELSGNSGDVFGYVDANNNIILNGNLADGNYSIKYEMEDEDGNIKTINIGDLVLDTNVYYSVISTLTNCTSSNSATQVVEGESYSATITANDGYELKTVTATMGGSPVTINGGSISIAEVTGNIEIAAVAEEKEAEVEPTNFFKASPTVNTTATASQDALVLGGRLGSDKTYRVDGGSDCLLTNYIAVQIGDVIYVKNMTLQTTLNSGLYDATKSVLAVFKGGANDTNVTSFGTDGEAQIFTIASSTASYIRLCGMPSAGIKVNASATTVTDKYDCSQIIVNIKRNGEWVGDTTVNPEIPEIPEVPDEPDEPSVTTYTNQIPISTDASGNLYNGGQGWKTGYRLNSSGAEAALSGIEVTGFIPFKFGDTLYVKNIVDDGTHVMAFYDSNYAKLATILFATGLGGACNGELMSKEINAYTATQIETAGDNIAFIRVSANEITAESIITVNEPIV